MKSLLYLDYAATTPVDPLVIEAMMPFWNEKFGNPSSIHTMGRQAKVEIEQARRNIAKHLGATASEIFFTSGATEAHQLSLFGLVSQKKTSAIITSTLEHHAVLHTLEYISKVFEVPLFKVKHDIHGIIDLGHLEELLQYQSNTSKNSHDRLLVSLMHTNNEVGTILPWENVANLVKQYHGIFHCDTVQSFGNFSIKVNEVPVDLLVGSGHKIYGPKGIGFVFIRQGLEIHPTLLGGSQERNMRAGTENVAAIVGLSKAFDLLEEHRTKRKQHLILLKETLWQKLQITFPDIQINGHLHGAPHILNVAFPSHPHVEMAVFKLDIEGLCVSGGSACNSGALVASHVLEALQIADDRPCVRFSMSHLTSPEDLDLCIEKVIKCFAIKS